jgi:hypothetical protein
MMNVYNLNNPTEAARMLAEITFDGEVILSSSKEVYKFNTPSEAIMYVLYNEKEFTSATLEDNKVHIVTPYESYDIRKLVSYSYKETNNTTNTETITDKLFKEDENKKLEFMEKEFNGQFSSKELDKRVENQALQILDVTYHTYIESKLERFLNKYFYGRWVKYTVETRKLNDISTQYTLKVTYDKGGFELNKPSNLICCNK